MYEAGDMLRRRADEVRSQFPGLDNHSVQVAIAPRSTMGAEASEEHYSEQSLSSCDQRDKPRVRLPLLSNPFPRLTDTQDLGLGLNGQKGPQFRSPFGVLFRPIASTGTSLLVRRTPEPTPKFSALLSSHAVKPKEGAEAQMKAGDGARTLSTSSGTNATTSQPTLAYAESAISPMGETSSDCRQRVCDNEAAARREIIERRLLSIFAEEKERLLARKAREVKVDPACFNPSSWWTDDESSNKPSWPAPQKDPISEPINDGTTEPLSAETPTAPALFNQPTKRKVPLPPTQTPSKKQHTERP